MKNPHVIWASVVIVFLLLTGAVTLVAMDKDVTVILSLAAIVAVPVLGAFGVAVYHKLDQVKEQGNGNLERNFEFQKRLLEAQQKTQEQLTALAMSMPASPSYQVTGEEEKPEGGDDDLPPSLLLGRPR